MPLPAHAKLCATRGRPLITNYLRTADPIGRTRLWGASLVPLKLKANVELKANVQAGHPMGAWMLGTL